MSAPAMNLASAVLDGVLQHRRARGVGPEEAAGTVQATPYQTSSVPDQRRILMV
jgi:hypothetical protein